MKRYWFLAKETVIEYVSENWNSDGYYNKGKLIFMGVVLFFILWKIIYSIFV
jgi:hypothetical protein